MLINLVTTDQYNRFSSQLLIIGFENYFRTQNFWENFKEIQAYISNVFEHEFFVL